VVKPIIERFINENNFEQATMGVYAYDKEVIPYLNNDISFSNGIYVAQIVKNGPASETDLKEGDIINSIDGKVLNTMNHLREYIYTKKPNDVVSLQISRGRINKTIQITLREKMRHLGQSNFVSLFMQKNVEKGINQKMTKKDKKSETKLDCPKCLILKNSRTILF